MVKLFQNSISPKGGALTNISRVRKGNVKNLEPFLVDFLQNYNLVRKCILSCSFVSKSQVKIEFEKIKRGQNVTGNIIQLLWIISSFAHACREMNVVPLIYCQD